MGCSMAACVTVPGFDVVNRAGRASWQGGRRVERQAGGHGEWDQQHCSGQAQVSQQLLDSHQETVKSTVYVNRN